MNEIVSEDGVLPQHYNGAADTGEHWLVFRDSCYSTLWDTGRVPGMSHKELATVILVH